MKATLCTLTDGTQEHGEIHDVNGDPLLMLLSEPFASLINVRGQQGLMLAVRLMVYDVALYFFPLYLHDTYTSACTSEKTHPRSQLFVFE